MFKISIITTVYKGNKYLNGYLTSLMKACRGFKENEIEVIWVNDSPECKVNYDRALVKGFELRIIENEKNVGIHQARINGLKKARGEYIKFLDQDDELLPDTVKKELEIAEKSGADFILSNGIMEKKDEKIKIFGNKFSQRFATKKKNYLLIKDFIVSPGQTLIRKSAIPDEWMKRPMEVNGCDDYLLWLMMFNARCKISCDYDLVYVHKYTEENLSDNEEWMKKSQLEMLKILKETPSYNRDDYKTLEKVIHYKHIYHKKFVQATVANLGVFLYNCYYRLVWRGYKVKIFR